jgi:hypothetical protein
VANPNEVWRRIAQSPLRGIYLVEAHSFAWNIVQRADDVFAQAPAPPPDETYIQVDHSLMGQLTTLLGEATRLRALVTPRGRNAEQTQAQHEVQVRRARWSRDEVLVGVELYGNL